MSVNTISALERSMFNDEFRVDFEREKTLLQRAVRSDGLMKAGTIFWDIVDPSEGAQERSRDGDIPVSQLGLSQVSATPVEYFGGKYRIDDFDAFKSNPNVRSMQYRKSVAACHRRSDANIIAQLNTATNVENTGSAVDMGSKGVLLSWISELWDRDVPMDGRVWGVITPKAYAQMMTIEEFTSSDYVSIREYDALSGLPELRVKTWAGVKWITHTGLSGHGSATAECHVFHEDAIGHQQAGEPDVHAYYYEPQHRWETYAVMRDATKKCLDRGIQTAIHNDTANVA